MECSIVAGEQDIEYISLTCGRNSSDGALLIIAMQALRSNKISAGKLRHYYIRC